MTLCHILPERRGWVNIMTWIPFKLVRTTDELKVYVAPDLGGKLILRSDSLRLNKAQIRFDADTLVLRGENVTFENENQKKCPVIAQTELKLPSRMVESCEWRIYPLEKITERLYQITTTERYDKGEEEVTLYSSVVKKQTNTASVIG